MKIALIHESYELSKLLSVIEEMKVLGPPHLRAIWCERRGFWIALEGCHRTRAARKLGLEPVMIPTPYKPGQTWADVGMHYEQEHYLVSLEWVYDNAGKELVIGFGEDAPEFTPPGLIRRPEPGEIMRYRIVRDIGFDFGGKIVTGLGTTFTSEDTEGKDVTDYVTMGYLVIDQDEPAKVTKEVGRAPETKLRGRRMEQDGVPIKINPDTGRRD